MPLARIMPLATRDPREEQMDNPALDAATYTEVLADLARVNRWTLSARPTLGFLGRVIAPGESLRLLDVGFGQGDMLRAIAGWAARRGIVADLVGVDLNPRSRGAALAVTPAGLPIDYRTGDYRDVEGPFDLIISSFVAHHMRADELTRFLVFMEQTARAGWLVNDLHRHTAAWLGFPLLARTMGVHPMVRQDGRLSIARAFRVEEWRAILADAGIGGEAQVVRRFPFRLCVERRF